MNKFFAIFALAVVAATACSASEDAKEVGLLLGNERVFEQFCLTERDAIIGDIRNQANAQTSGVFEIFFGAATEIADEVMAVEQKAVEEFTKELKQPSEQISDAPLPESEIERLIEQGKKEIQQQSNVFGRLVAAGKNMVGSVLYNAANSAIFVRLAKARSYMNGRNLLLGIVQTCEQVAKYEDKLRTDLESTKSELAKENAADAELVKFIESMSVPKLKCYTTKYISRLDGFCDLFRNGAGALMKMLGLGSNYKLPSEVTINQ